MRKPLLLVVFVGCFVMSCSNQTSTPSKPQGTPGSAITAMAKMANLATDPLAQMSFEFDGNPSKDEIGEKLDKVLTMYKLELTNENRGSAGRTLVALRKEHGHSEMSILDKMLSSAVEGEFNESAARISAAMNQ